MDKRPLASHTVLGIVLICTLAVFMFVPKPDYLYEKGFAAAATHHLWHASWLHLAVNCLAVWAAFTPKRRWTDLPLAWLFASVSFCATSCPVIGFSNILFALAGLSAGGYGKSYWKAPASWVFVAVMFAMLFFPQFSAVTHIVSFSLGFGYGAARRIIIFIQRDYERIYR